MIIDKYRIYQLDDYSYENFVTLGHDDLHMILGWRNHPDVSKWMVNTAPIAFQDHLGYVEGLKQREDAYYWLIKRKGNPIGVLNVVDVDHRTASGEPGFYLAPELVNRGEGIMLLRNYKEMLFSLLDFKILIGHNYIENINALQLSLFFGATIDGIELNNGRKYFVLELKKENFKSFRNENLILSYVKYAKSNPVELDEVLSKYE